MANYFCEYCGNQSTSVFQLALNTCHRHPLGSGKGKHKLYEGSEKATYQCKYCGNSAPTIFALTQQSCFRRTDGKGNHIPAL